MPEFESGITIYTITNRLYEKLGENIELDNEVSSDTTLYFFKTYFYKPDSLRKTIMNQEDFMTEISAIHNNWLLFIHGDSKTFEQAVMRGFDIQHLYGVNVLVFSWPSKDPEINGIKNFKNSKQNVIHSMNHFNSLLGCISMFKKSNHSFIKNSKLSLFIHSLGNAYLENLIKQFPDYKVQENLFDNIILNAAAVNQENHKAWVEQLNFQNQIYITFNKQDFNLKGVRIFTKDGKQLGEKIEKPLAENANYINFSEAVGFRTPTGITHTYFIGKIVDESVTIKNFYNEILHGQQPDLLDKKTFQSRKDGIGYDISY